MRIAIVGSGGVEIPQIGGSIDKNAFYVAEPLCRQGHQVDFYCSKNSPQAAKPPIPNLQVHKLAHPNFLFLARSNIFILVRLGIHLNMIAFALSLLFHLARRRERADVIHVHTRYDAAAILLLQKLFRYPVPLVFTCHTAEWNRKKIPGLVRAFYLPELWALKKAAAVISVCENQRQGMLALLSLDPERVTTVHWGINKGLFRNHTGPSAEPYVLCVSDLIPRKNQLLLVRALPEILRYVPNCRLVLIGGTPDRGYLAKVREVTAELRVGGSLDIRGRLASTEEVIRWVNGAWVCAYPFLSEGLPQALLEALSCSKAVVTSQIPEVLEIKNLAGADAFVTASTDDPAAWAEGIVSLLKDSEKRRTYEKVASQVVCDIPEMAQRYFRVYEKAVARRDQAEASVKKETA